MMSLVVPVYRNSGNIAPLVAALESLSADLGGDLEVVFVVDGSPDDSFLRLAQALPAARFRSQLLSLSRNFGSFAAIRAGLEAGRGDRFAVMAADLQEPPELIREFDALLRGGDVDVAVGRRVGRKDPLLARTFSAIYWGLYRRFVQPEIPPGGVDIFGCRANVRDQIVLLRENNSSLVGLLFWVGFRRADVPYERSERTIGKSAWTFRNKLRYMLDSVYSFTDLPIRLLTRIGVLGLLTSVVLALVVVWAKLSGTIPVPGYAASVLVVTFFGALNCFGLGVIGNYVWRAFENGKRRPNFIVASQQAFEPGGGAVPAPGAPATPTAQRSRDA
jgi:glycosyltransferase involved in cell wall biosynthesis